MNASCLGHCYDVALYRRLRNPNLNWWSCSQNILAWIQPSHLFVELHRGFCLSLHYVLELGVVYVLSALENVLGYVLYLLECPSQLH